MKVQCPCGTKLSFDVTPDAAHRPLVVQCPTCNADLSAAVIPLVAQVLAEMANTAPAPAVAPAPLNNPQALTPPSPPPQTAAPKARLHVSTPAASATTPSPAQASPELSAGPICSRHTGEVAGENCRVCQKPICPRCMAQFGFVCSAYCQGKAENLGIDVLDYAGQNRNVNVRSNRLFKLSIAAAVLLILSLVGLWGLNEFYLSQPRILFSIPVAKSEHHPSGRWGDASSFVVLHEAHLTRYSLKTQKAHWSVDIVTSNDFTAAARVEAPKARTAYAFWRSEQMKKPKQYDSNGHEIWYDEVPTETEQYQKTLGSMFENALASLRLVGEGTNVWIAQPGKLQRYRWEDGSSDKTIPIEFTPSESMGNSPSLSAFTPMPSGERKLVRVDLRSGEVEEKIFQTDKSTLALSKPASATAGQVVGEANRKGVGSTPVASGAHSNRKSSTSVPVANSRALASSTRDPLATIPKGLSGPEAAIAAIQLQSNTKLEAALNDNDELGPRKRHAQLIDKSRVEWQVSGDRMLKLTSLLVEFKAVNRQNLKEAPKRSALEGATSVTSTSQVANEILNAMRRDQTDGMSVDDKSTYHASLRYAGESETAGWSGDFVGSPDLYALTSVTVLIADTSVVVFDKNNHKLWETRLTYPLTQRAESWNLQTSDSESGGGPVIEHGDTLYILDPGVVGAFDKSTGNARWRLPTVGASGLQFDSKGCLYINTTTMSQDQVRFDQQVDVSKKDRWVLIKAEASTGRILWRATHCGQLAAITPDAVYTSEVITSGTGILKQNSVTHLYVYQLNPKSGKVIWDHASRGEPSYLGIQGSKILVVRENTVDVLTHGILN